MLSGQDSSAYLRRPRCNESLLLVIDVQERLVPVIEASEDLVERHCVLLQGLKALEVKTVFSEQYPKGLGSTVTALWPWVEEGDRNCFAKTSFSFVDAHPELITAWKEDGINHIILTGMETHICVYQTARDLLALGFMVTVVSDCVGSRWKEDSDMILSLMRHMGVRVMPTETLLFDLLAEAGTTQFKQISQLIK